MKATGYSHTPAALPPQGRHPLLYPLKEGRVGARHFGEEINLLPMPGYTTQIVLLTV